MTRHALPLVALMLALIAGALAAQGPPEPSYGLKPYSYWIERLRSSNPDERADATQALGTMAGDGLDAPRLKETLQLLVAALNDPVPMVRYRASEGLGRSHDPGGIAVAADAWLAWLKDSDRRIRVIAADYIRSYGPYADAAKKHELVLALVREIEDSDSPIREDSAFSVGPLRDPAAAPSLRAALKAGNGVLRGNSIVALGLVGDASAIPDLVAAINRAEKGELAKIAEAVGRIGEREVAASRGGTARDRARLQALLPAAQPLLDATKGMVVLRDRFLLMTIAEALGKLGPVTVPALIAAMQNRQNEVSTRLVAVMAAGKIGPAAKSALPVLKKLVEERDQDLFLVGEGDTAIGAIQAQP